MNALEFTTSNNGFLFLTAMSSLGGTFAHPKPVVACDECPFRIMRKGDQWPEAAQKRVKIDIVGGFFKALVGIPN